MEIQSNSKHSSAFRANFWDKSEVRKRFITEMSEELGIMNDTYNGLSLTGQGYLTSDKEQGTGDN